MPRYMVKRNKEMSLVIDADDAVEADEGARQHNDEDWQVDEDVTLDVVEVDPTTPLSLPDDEWTTDAPDEAAR